MSTIKIKANKTNGIIVGRIYIFVICFITCLLIYSINSVVALASDSVNIRVLLQSSSENISISVYQGEYAIFDSALGERVAKALPGDTLFVNLNSSVMTFALNGNNAITALGSFMLIPVTDNCIFTFRSTMYHGGFSVLRDESRLLSINTLEIEEYLYGVLGKEIGYDVPLEALKAQAVVARSYAFAEIELSDRYDVTALTVSQVYGGYSEEIIAAPYQIKRAVDETRGEVMLYRHPQDGKTYIVKGYYHSNGGGHTEASENIWGGRDAFPTKGVVSPWDVGHQNFSWQVIYTVADMIRIANEFGNTDIGQLLDINVVKTDDSGNPTPSGRATRVEIIGTKATVIAEKDGIRQALGGIVSTLIEVEIGSEVSLAIKDAYGNIVQTTNTSDYYILSGSDTEQLINTDLSSLVIAGSGILRDLSQEIKTDDQVTINGNGSGHGVGMSQAGALGMAQSGSTYQEILAYYYFSAGEGFFLGQLSLLQL